MKRYRFHWLTGDVDEGEGSSPEDAFTHLGYGAGALPALDYFEEILPDDGVERPFVWELEHDWVI
jgi:hypothetical protein